MNRTKLNLLAAATVALLLCVASAGAANLTVTAPGLGASTSVACPSGCKLSVNFDGDPALAFVVDTTPVGETTYRAKFWIRHNDVVLPTAPTKTHRFIEFRKDAPLARVLAFASIYFRDGRHKINFMAYDENNVLTPVGGYVLSLASNQAFTFEWQAATAMGADNGIVRVIKGAEVKEILDYNYYNGGSGVDSLRFGVTRAPDAGVLGNVYLDSFESFRTLAP
jgi:hypothetical protein